MLSSSLQELSRGSGPRIWASVWACLLVLVAHLSQPCTAVDRGASIILRARWQASPYLMEAAEMVAEEQPLKFWTFLEDTLKGTQPDDVTKCWAHILHLTVSHMAPGTDKVAALVLASRKHSAKVAMYDQLARQLHPDIQACCFVDVAGQVVQSAEALDAVLKQVRGSTSNGSATIIEEDHVFPSPSGVPAAILYAPIGAACTRPLHKALKAAAEEGQVMYAFRPVLQDTCKAAEGTCIGAGSEDALLLPGWGVEAVLKNTEYSAMDDKERKASQAASAQATGGTASKGTGQQVLGAVKGFDFDTLVARKPALSQELLTFRDHLLSSDEEESVKVWEVKDVGLQAAQRIMQAADPLSLFMELSQNFPSLVSSLSRQEVNSSMRDAVSHNQQYVSAGGNYMLLNGLTVDLNDFDYFGFLDRIQSELQLVQQLTQLNLTQQDTRHLLQLRTDDKMDTLDDVRLDMGLSGDNKDKVFWLNDLQKDSVYTERGYSTNIQEILNVFPGRLRPMALNLFNLVLVLDPVSGPALTWATFVERMWTDMYPIRLGLMPKVPAVLDRIKQGRANPFAKVDKPVWESMSVSEKFGLAFLTLDKAWGSKYPVIFWMTVSRFVQREHSWGDVDDTLRQCFETTWNRAIKETGRAGGKASKKDVSQAWKDVITGTDWSAEAGSRLHEINAMLDKKGIANSKHAVGWLNGIQIAFSATSDQQTLQQELLYKVMTEQQRVQEAVYFGRINEGDDVLTSLADGNSLIRWNPKLMAREGLQYAPMVDLVQDAKYQTGVPRFTAPLSTKGKGVSKTEQVHAASHLMVVDLDSKAGRQLAAEALRFLADNLPGSDNARIQLLLNPAYPDDTLTTAPPTMLEAVVHLALSQLPQITGQAPEGVVSSQQTVATFLHSLLGDAALATRLSGPLQKSSSSELEVVLAPAKKAGIQTDPVKRGLLNMLDVEPSATGSLNIKPPPALVQLRTSHAYLARDVLHLPVGCSAVISNGRVAARYDATAAQADEEEDAAEQQDVDFVAEDLSLLTSLVTTYQPGALIATQIQQAYEQGRLTAPEPAKSASSKKGSNNEEAMSRLDDIVVVVAVAIATSSKADNLQVSKQLAQVLPLMEGGMVEVAPPAGISPSGLHIACVLNPLTRPAQRISQVLSLLRHSEVAPTISLLLNPAMDLSDLPLKSFYRYALPDLAPGGQAREVAPSPPSAHFTRLPSKRVLTLNMDVPEAWLVEAVQAQHDLDNLRLADIPEPVAHAELELSALMLTGSCIDVTGGRVTPSRGVQLHLGTHDQPHVVDTLVMSNLAYFQLKAAPGSWRLSLAPGRTHELYQMVASGAASAHTMHLSGALQDAVHESRTQVLVSSLAGKHIILQIKKRPGKEEEDVLKQAGEKGGSKSDPYAYPYGGADEEEEDTDDEYEAGDTDSSKKTLPGGDTINIFTVASGHMYERLQKIMMLSVLKHTQSKVKFWFISNYMSPHHKQVIPLMAKKYGFEYAFVTYKWPHWLHKQTDKQRTIWAYKILFLDVLFPLDVERIIFVDSDQVVRTDLAELYHMDIKGKPYAYTPFCDNNKDMDEFRFWKGGFWHGHLQGKPYHISALYLVDLKKFRSMAAGDQLRVVYEQLSKDPNSLANLDQDLPNYTQHQIPIFSLSQEWLWCESWCGNATKHLAKTIDLCNNPRTKEPKLTAARRIIAEWPNYDRIQADITEEIDAELGFGTITSAQDPGPITSSSSASTPTDSTSTAHSGAAVRWQAEDEDDQVALHSDYELHIEAGREDNVDVQAGSRHIDHSEL